MTDIITHYIILSAIQVAVNFAVCMVTVKDKNVCVIAVGKGDYVMKVC